MLMHGERFVRRHNLHDENDLHEPVSQDVSTMRPRLCLALRTHSPFTMSKIIRSAAANLKLVSVRLILNRAAVKALKELVEPIGIEPMTPCLQSRCSPS